MLAHLPDEGGDAWIRIVQELVDLALALLPHVTLIAAPEAHVWMCRPSDLLGRIACVQGNGGLTPPGYRDVFCQRSECLMMSLVENIVRRTHRPIDLMREIGALRSRGYSDTAIAEKIGVGASWVNMVASLLERGEERLVAAVETGLIPITLAMEISKAETEEAQNLLLDAYETGKLRGKKLAAVRRMLDMRMRAQGKGLPIGRLGRKTSSRRMTAADLMQVYQREAEKQRLLVKKSDFTQTRLLFIVEALKDLLAKDGFVNLLRAEGLATMPRALAARVSGGEND